eukprot:1369362-Amorphochlora_amoeboformis.AAC.2
MAFLGYDNYHDLSYRPFEPTCGNPRVFELPFEGKKICRRLWRETVERVHDSAQVDLSCLSDECQDPGPE